MNKHPVQFTLINLQEAESLCIFLRNQKERGNGDDRVILISQSSPIGPCHHIVPVHDFFDKKEHFLSWKRSEGSTDITDYESA